jgi:DNA-binding NtrC family response regulator
MGGNGNQSVRARVVVVDDDAIVARSLAAFYEQEGCEAVACSDAEGAMGMLAESCGSPTVVVLDVHLGGEDGIEALRRIRAAHPGVAVVMLTGYATVETAVEALRVGAIDFLTKPIVDDELRAALDRALTHAALGEGATRSRRDRVGSSAMEGVIGSDARMVRINEIVRAVAPSRTTVLMSGESGVGKSMIARAIHDASDRKRKPFVELSCGSIPETLLESELFGHVKGAFTGAHADKIGRFEAARGGTLFLDEINSAPPSMQLKLLRVLQEKRFERVGSSETIEADVRVVLASNEDLEALVASGEFREDLYHRINVVTIDVPALRERPGDIDALAEHFLNEQRRELGRAFVGFSDDAMAALRAYAYPGNVRELSNIVEHACVLAKGLTIGVDNLPERVVSDRGASAGLDEGPREDGAFVPMSLHDALLEPERRIILETLGSCDWNRTRAAEILGINRTTLYKKMKALGIDPEAHARAG